MTDSPQLRDLKRRLREQAMALRAVTKSRAGDGDARAIGHASELIAQWPDAAVSGFYSFDSEIDCLGLLDALGEAGHVTALPVVVAPKTPLIFRRWRRGDPMDTGVYDIPIPRPEAGEVIPDVLIVPLLAFDARGYRLGYGGGFYDRTLERLRTEHKVIAVGFGYGAQEVDTVPAGPNDQRVDWIVTEDGAREASRAEARA